MWKADIKKLGLNPDYIELKAKAIIKEMNKPSGFDLNYVAENVNKIKRMLREIKAQGFMEA